MTLRHLGRAPGVLAALVAMIVLGYGPVTPEIYSAVGAAHESADAVVVGGSPFGLSVPLAGRGAAARPVAARPWQPTRRSVTSAAAAAAALLLGLAGLSARNRGAPMAADPAEGPGRSGARALLRRRGPPLLLV
jgi:hypothetical protein